MAPQEQYFSDRASGSPLRNRVVLSNYNTGAAIRAPLKRILTDPFDYFSYIPAPVDLDKLYNASPYTFIGGRSDRREFLYKRGPNVRMGVDPLSPIAPARVRVLLLPVGKIKRARFLSFVERLQPENVVRLGDISPDGRPNRNMFSPLAFPSGMIVYDLSTSLPPQSHLSLSPFETYREPLAIITVADGKELAIEAGRNQNGTSNGKRPLSYHSYIRESDQELEVVRDQYPKALVHQMFIFDYKSPPGGANLPDGLVGIPPLIECKTTTMRTVMCDFSSMLLAEMTTLAKSFQARAMIESPSQARALSQNNGYSWGTLDDTLGRPNSVSTPDRTDSSKGDRATVRMSMPAVLRRTPSEKSRSDSTSRPTTPMNGQELGEPKSPEAGPLQRAKNETFRDHSRDRISVQGFGSGSSNEITRNKGKGRVGVVIGSLYLQAGRWNDSLKELVDAATLAKNSGDHLWHAKALELIMVSMFMLAWIGLDFQVPQICYTTAEKAPYHTPSSTAFDQSGSIASNRLVSLSNLGTLLPELLAKILHLYERSSNRIGESLPQLAYSESAIRFSKVLSAIHLARGKLDDDVLQLMILGKELPTRPNTKTPRLNIHPTRSSVTATLFRAFPSASAVEELNIIDRTLILSGIAAVLGELGYHRKKAMVLRELISVIMPGLIQARLLGAAEMGIHPSAGGAALSGVTDGATLQAALELRGGDLEAGIDDLLRLIGQVYGVVSWAPSTTYKDARIESLDDSNDAIVARIMRNARLRVFGGHDLKMNVLRASVDLLEALPDHRAILKFTSDLLRTAGSGIAPGPRSLNASPAMSREEQLRLTTSIYKCVAAGKKLGLPDLAAEYWDEFLVRGVELEPQATSRTPVPHQASELGTTTILEDKDRNPFIYNPFLRRPDALGKGRLLVSGENAVFKVTLQNPYDIDIEIERVSLEAEGVKFEPAVQHTLIGPYRTQILAVNGTPKEAGSLSITGCLVKIKGCRERRFPIFADPWSPKSEMKIKTVGLDSAEKDETTLRPVTPNAKPPVPEITPPKPSSLTVTVIDQQPIVVVKSTTLSQSAIMILEGEKQQFSVTLQNLSQTTPADLVLFSFQDSTQGPLQTALNSRDASPAELYEYELILLRKQALRWVKESQDPYIAPGGTATFHFEVLGKPGLTHCSIQVDYCCLGQPVTEVKDTFHTRQASLPLTVTVNASVELARMDILPLTGDIPKQLRPKDSGDNVSADDYCILLLDLRNAWPSVLHINLEMSEGHNVQEDILPGQTSRVLFPIQRIFLEDPYAAIPELDPSKQRQFVDRRSRVTADSERATREAFWFREAILKILSGRWNTITGPRRQGEIELRGMRLSPRTIEALKVEEVTVEVSVGEQSQNSDNEIEVDTFNSVIVQIHNKSKDSLNGLLRIQPCLKNFPHIQALDMSKKLVWNGTLQCTVPAIPPRGTAQVSFGVTALCKGEFDIGASFEELRLEADESRSKVYDASEPSATRPRANTKSMMDAILGGKVRRIWHARQPCVLVAKESNDSDDEDDV